MFAVTSGMLDGEDDNFVGVVVGRIIDQIRIAPRYQLAHALNCLLAPNMWKQDQILK